ncbi:MAG TPA: sigma factor [Polyangiaceae bacterium]|nr:sigma factor [Polyangiaceae bacterium]
MPVLVAEFWPVLVAFAQRGLGCAPDAEDVAQEVLLKICAKISHFDRARDGVSWAFGIAAFELMSERKRRQRRRESAPEATLETLSHATASAEEQLIEQELLLALESALGTLAPADLALLGRGAGVSSASGSASGATLRKRRQRALDRLRTIWRHLHGEP